MLHTAQHGQGLTQDQTKIEELLVSNNLRSLLLVLKLAYFQVALLTIVVDLFALECLLLLFLFSDKLCV